VKEKGKETTEEICVERFLNWYNKRQNRNYIYEKATDCFTDLKDKLNWDFIAYERANPQEWIGIELKELDPLRKETSVFFTFWERLCSDLPKDLPGKGIQGEFEISFPPVFDLPQNDRQRFLEAFIQVLIHRQSGWKVGETKDIGPEVWNKFPNWPTQRSDVDEWDEWGRDRPCKLEITKVSDSGCKVRVGTSPLVIGDVIEEDKKALNAVFKLKNGIVKPDRQLELAKKKGARKTILLLANIGVDEYNTGNSVQNCLDQGLISHIDCIYLVDMGNGRRVVKIYPS